MPLVTQAELGKRMGLSRQRISQLVRDGVVEVVSKVGKKHLVDLDAAMKAIEEYRDPSRKPQAEAAKKMAGRQAAEKEVSIFDERVLPEKSIADLSDSEKAASYNELLGEITELRKIRDKANRAGVSIENEKIPKSLNKVRIFKEVFLGKLAQLEYKKKSGELVSAEDSKREFYEAGRLMRDKLTGMPKRLSSVFATMDDPVEIEKIFTSEIISTIEEVIGDKG